MEQYQISTQQESLIKSILYMIENNINKKRFKSNRMEQLKQLIIQLFLGGVSTIEIFMKQTTLDLILKGFTLRESFILLRELNNQTSIKPTNTEIENFVYDKTLQQLALNISPINSIQLKKKSLSYILFLGPKNRGKTTFLLNLINGFYSVNVDSLYRVQRKLDAQTGIFLDEYEVEIDKDKSLIFVDVKGIGDVTQDIVGNNEKNLFIQLLEYLQNKNVLAAFFINSASINRLGQDEKYQIQRFFELFHQSFLNRILLILTFCTDNQPILNIYQHPNSPAPKSWKRTINDFINFGREHQLHENNKFWFGINNNFLYQPPVDLNQECQNILFNYQNENEIDYIQNISIIERGQDLSQIIDTQTILDEQAQEIELTQKQIHQFYYEIMKKQIDDIINRIKQFQRENLSLEHQWSYWKKLLNLEQQLYSLTKSEQINQSLFTQKISPNLKAVYLDLLTIKGDPIIIKSNKDQKILFCSDCQVECHRNCELLTKEELANNKKMCSKFQIKLEYLNSMANPSRKVSVQQLDQLYYCKMCAQRETNNKLQNNNQEMCSITNHIFLNEIQLDQKCDIVFFKQDNNHISFKNDYYQYKKEKKVLRMKQQFEYTLAQQEFQKIIEIRQIIDEINSQKIGSVPINCQIRQQQLNETFNAGAVNDTQILSSINIYNKMFPQQLKKQLSKGKATIIKIIQNQGDE